MLPWQLNSEDKTLIDLALREDLQTPWHDVTTATLFTKEKTRADNFSQAVIVSKMDQPLKMCGAPVLHHLVAQASEPCQLEFFAREGETLAPYSKVLKIQGKASTLLMIERVMLNFLQRLLAIATFTAQCVEKIQGTSLQLLDTRKTMPGWRHLDKYAVICGGGVNHRSGLYDAVMVKDTHSDMLGGLRPALAALPLLQQSGVPVIVEVRNRIELQEVLRQGQGKVTRVLLDNMNFEELRACVALCRGKLQTEASGNINLQTLSAVASTGVDFASMGALTHSAPHIDLSMREYGHE